MHITTETITRSTFTMDKGEKIPMHVHPFMHNTRVLTGRSWVEVKEVTSFGMSSAAPAYELPANIPHEITAMIDGTVVVNEQRKPTSASPDLGLPVETAGVMLADGTVVKP